MALYDSRRRITASQARRLATGAVPQVSAYLCYNVLPHFSDTSTLVVCVCKYIGMSNCMSPVSD